MKSANSRRNTTAKKHITPHEKRHITPHEKKFSSNKIMYIKDPKILNIKEFPTFSYEGGNGFTAVKFLLNKNEQIRANGGSMNYMSSNIEIETKMNSVLNSIKRKLSGATLFYNTFTNKGSSKEVIQFSGVTPGNISCLYIPKGCKIKLTFDNYIASTPNLVVSGRASFGGVITGYGLFYTTIEAIDSHGLVWISSFGELVEIKLKPDEKIQVDNGILLALEDDIEFQTGLLGGIKSFLFSSEGIITSIHNTFKETRTIYLQSRSKLAFVDYIRNIVDSQILINKLSDATALSVLSNSNNNNIGNNTLSSVSNWF